MPIGENPFTPSFGEVPAHVAGRRSVIEAVLRALKSERRRPDLTTLLSGARGTGKTALLSLLARDAEGLGWISASVTAMPGMLEDIELRTMREARHLLPESKGVHVTGVSIPQVAGISFERDEGRQGNWRSRMDDLLDALETTGTGLLITVDEIDVELDELKQLATVYQHFVREGRKVGLLMAGLPNNVSSLVSNKTVSFLRRAQIVYLGRIEDYEIEDAMDRSIREAGRSIGKEDLRRAVRAIDGFPFMMQLVGYRAWEANPDHEEITSADVSLGIEIAGQEMRSRILEATYRELSPEDIRFARAMLDDEGDSRIADIRGRLGKSSSQIAQYRKRLMDAGVIGARSRGFVGFDLPLFREFLEEKPEF
ncbi:MAG: ATP-binding protein [Atopobiaceae bacterium]|jgi:hypothetical protein